MKRPEFRGWSEKRRDPKKGRRVLDKKGETLVAKRKTLVLQNFSQQKIWKARILDARLICQKFLDRLNFFFIFWMTYPISFDFYLFRRSVEVFLGLPEVNMTKFFERLLPTIFRWSAKNLDQLFPTTCQWKEDIDRIRKLRKTELPKEIVKFQNIIKY